MVKNLLKNTDFILLILVLILVCLGCVAIYSANYSSGDTEYIKQIIWFGVRFCYNDCSLVC